MFELDFAARVDPGLVRETIPDVARTIPRLGLALVADEGRGHGGVAVQMAADAVEQTFARLGGPGEHPEATVQRLQRAFQAANQRMEVCAASGEGGAKAGVMFVAAVFAHGRAIIGNVGHSRCYRVRNRLLELLTRDHMSAAQLRQQGTTMLPQGRQAAADWAHQLTRSRSLSGEEGVVADIRSVRCEPGDVFLLCSDGLWGSVSDDTLTAILGTAQRASEACERLVGAAWAGGGLDSIGAAVIRLPPLQLRLNEPSWLDPLGAPSDQPAGECTSAAKRLNPTIFGAFRR